MTASSNRPSFGNLLGGMERLFPLALLSGEGLARLLAVADQLPLCASDRQFGFEFALCNEAAAADFCVVVEPGSALAAHYVRLGVGADRGSAAAALGTFLDSVASDPTSFLARREGGIILEYDVLVHRPRNAPPGIFFVPRDRSISAARKLLEEPVDAVTALWTAAGLRADPAELEQVERVFEILSDAALIAQAGVFAGRSRRAVRLVAHRIEAAELPNLLDRLRWPGSKSDVLSVTEATSDLTKPGIVLSLDVSASGVSPRMGVELFRPGQQLSIDRAGWGPIIERLTDRRWCLPGKADGLREWPRTEKLLGLGGVYQAYQYINHLKIVVDRGSIAAKAYAGMVVCPSDEVPRSIPSAEGKSCQHWTA